MKKLLCVLLAALFLAVSIIPVAAVGEGKGITVNDNEKYQIDKPFEKVALSYEAWVSVPPEHGRVGVVIGNYAGSTACANFEITTNGRPRLYVVEYTSGEKVIHDVTFKDVDIRTGEMVHLAIVHDPAASATYCYVGGELKSTVTGALNITDEVCKKPYMLAGDNRSGNVQYFKCNLGEVALYSDIRTADEIKADMNGIDNSDDELLLHYDLFGGIGDVVVDKSGNGYDITRTVKWMAEKEPVTDYAYSFCVIGDTQIVTQNYPDQLACIYDWIIANKEEKKIEFVFGMGDITNKSTDEEWAVAKEQISKLNGVVPYSIVRGNHDTSEKLNEYFAKLDYMAQFGGFYDRYKIDNSWRTFSVGEVDYLLVTLDFGPSDTLLNWASDIIAAHPEHRVIITTHCYLFRDGTTLDASDVAPPNSSGANDGKRNNGDQMWDKLISKHENIFLVLSGHDPCDNIIVTQTEGDCGNIVTQMLVDPQGVDAGEGATGMVAMLYFSEDGKTVTVENYSTVRDMYYMNTSQMTVELPESYWTEKAPEQQPTAPENGDEETAPNTEDKTTSTGDIGGTDGPTAILTSGSVVPIVIVCAAIAIAVGLAIGFVVGKKSK